MRSTIVEAPLQPPTQIVSAPPSRAGRAGQAARAQPHGFSKRHPLLMFFAMAFAISYVGILLVLRFGGDGPVTPTDPRFLLMMLAWLAGPSVASLVMTGLVSGKSGYRELFARLAQGCASRNWCFPSCAWRASHNIGGSRIQSIAPALRRSLHSVAPTTAFWLDQPARAT